MDESKRQLGGADIFLYQKSPLTFGISDLIHSDFPGYHLLPHHLLRFKFRHFTIYTVLIKIILLCSIKDLFSDRQMLCQHTGQKFHTPIGRFIPEWEHHLNTFFLAFSPAAYSLLIDLYNVISGLRSVFLNPNVPLFRN